MFVCMCVRVRVHVCVYMLPCSCLVVNKIMKLKGGNLYFPATVLTQYTRMLCPYIQWQLLLVGRKIRKSLK